MCQISSHVRVKIKNAIFSDKSTEKMEKIMVAQAQSSYIYAKGLRATHAVLIVLQLNFFFPTFFSDDFKGN